MTDKKITQLTSQTNNTSEDLLLVVDDPNGSPVSKKQTIKAFFGRVPANTVFTANVSITGNKLLSAANVVATKFITTNNQIVTLKSGPSSNNATSVGLSIGQFYFTNSYGYVAVNATTIRRFALSTFTGSSP